MSRYIDRKELLKAMDSWDKYGYYPSGALVREPENDDYVPYVHYDDMVKCVKSMPTVDVVEKLIEDITDEISERIIKFLEENYEIIPKKPVVQCKDCKYGCVSRDVNGSSFRFCNSPFGHGLVTEDCGYCSYGEKRTDVKEEVNINKIKEEVVNINKMIAHLEELGLHQEKQKGWDKLCQGILMRMR